MTDDLEMYSKKGPKRKAPVKKDTSFSRTGKSLMIEDPKTGAKHYVITMEQYADLEKLIKRQAEEIRQLRNELNVLRAETRNRPAQRPTNNGVGSPFG